MKIGLSLGVMAVFQTAASFAIQFFVLLLVGAGNETDAWIAAQAVPMVLYSIGSVALLGAWQSRLAKAKDLAAIIDVLGIAQGQLILVFGLLTFFLIITASAWVGLFFPGLTAEQISAVVRMSYALLFGSLLNCQSILLTTAFRSRNRFLFPEFVAIASMIGSIALIFVIVPKFGIEAAAWISCFRSLVLCGVLMLAIKSPKPSIGAALKDIESRRQMRPLLFGTAFTKTGPIVDRYFSSFAPPGGMTIFSFIQLGMGAMAMVFDRAINTQATPNLARFVASGDLLAVRNLYRQRIGYIAVLSGIVLITLVVSRQMWIDVAGSLFEIDVYRATDAWILALIFVGYMFPAAAGAIVVSTFYAFGDTRTPTVISVVGFILSLVLKALGFFWEGLLGLAVATALHYMGNMVVMCLFVEQKLSGATKR